MSTHSLRISRALKRTVRTVLAIFAAVLLFVSFLAFCLRWSSRVSESTVILVALLPYLALSAAALGLCAVISKAKLGTMVCGIAVFVAMLPQAPLFIPGPHQATKSAQCPVRAMQFNAFFGLADPENLKKVLMAENVNLLAVEELTPQFRIRMEKAGISRLLKYSFIADAPGAEGTGLWSTTPLTQGELLPGFSFNNLVANTVRDGTRLSVVGMHVLPDFQGVWQQEMASFHTFMQSLPDTQPAVILGDFNSTHDHQQFRQLLDTGFFGGADVAGAGFRGTWIHSKLKFPPLFAIDHILFRGFTAKDYKTIPIKGSDHSAVVLSLCSPRQ